MGHDGKCGLSLQCKCYAFLKTGDLCQHPVNEQNTAKEFPSTQTVVSLRKFTPKYKKTHLHTFSLSTSFNLATFASDSNDNITLLKENSSVFEYFSLGSTISQNITFFFWKCRSPEVFSSTRLRNTTAWASQNIRNHFFSLQFGSDNFINPKRHTHIHTSNRQEYGRDKVSKRQENTCKYVLACWSPALCVLLKPTD